CEDGGDNPVVELLLGAKVIVDVRLWNTRAFRDLAGGCAVKALFRKDSFSRLQYFCLVALTNRAHNSGHLLRSLERTTLSGFFFCDGDFCLFSIHLRVFYASHGVITSSQTIEPLFARK